MTGAGQTIEAYAAAIHAQDWSGLRALLTDDVRCRLVRTGEHLGADDYVAFNRDYPGSWAFRLDDVVAAGDRVAARVRVSDGPEVHHVALFATVRHGVITALDEVWTEDTSTDSTSITTSTTTSTTEGAAP